VDLYAVPRGEAVAASCVSTDGEAESLVVLHRRIEVMDGGAMRSIASASQRIGVGGDRDSATPAT
jgi:hypothetical protein